MDIKTTQGNDITPLAKRLATAIFKMRLPNRSAEAEDAEKRELISQCQSVFEDIEANQSEELAIAVTYYNQILEAIPHVSKEQEIASLHSFIERVIKPERQDLYLCVFVTCLDDIYHAAESHFGRNHCFKSYNKELAPEGHECADDIMILK